MTRAPDSQPPLQCRQSYKSDHLTNGRLQADKVGAALTLRLPVAHTICNTHTALLNKV